MTEKQAMRVLVYLNVIRKEMAGEVPRRYRVLNYCDKVAVIMKKDIYNMKQNEQDTTR